MDSTTRARPPRAQPAVPQQVRRRRAAADRCEPLDDGYRDPRHREDDGPVTEKEVEAWRAAWAHLRALGLTPIVPAHVVLAGLAQRYGDTYGRWST